MIWTLCLLLHAVLLCLILHSRRSRCDKDPPLDKGIIPWLGHALEFGKDAAKFLNRMKAKHGDIFTVRVAGHYVTVLLDPHSFDHVLTDPDSLDFSRYARVLMERIFSLRLPQQHQPIREKQIMKRHFQGLNLASLSASMHRHLQALLTAETPQNRTDWKEAELFSFCYAILFKAGYLSLFGGEQNNNSNDTSEIYEKYRTFDGLLTKLARGRLGADERRRAQSVRQRLCEALAPGSSPWLDAYRQLLRDEGSDEETQRRALLMQLWATQGNVGPAAFWLLGFLLTHPDAMAAVRQELSGLSRPLLDGSAHTPVFDSALEETLRLTAAPFITREVLQDKAICLSDGQEYLLRRGDRVCLFPFLSPQMDPEIHQEPQKFKYDRFLSAAGSPRTDFSKGGRRLKYYTMPWGAGANGCVGRDLAIATIRQFVHLLLSHLDVELCDLSAGLPQIDTGRYGFGMLQPRGDVTFRYKARCPL